MNRQQVVFIVVADAILLAVIAFLFGLALDKDFVLKDRLKNLSSKKQVVQNENRKDQLAKPAQPFFLRAENPISLRSDGEPFNPQLLVKGKDLYLNSLSGSAYRFSLKENALLGRIDSTLKSVSSLVPFGKDFLFMDSTGRFYNLMSKSMTIVPYFYYSSGGQMLDFPSLADMDKDGKEDLLFPDSFSRVVCLNGKTFSPLWTFQDSSDIVCRSPIVLNVNADRNPDAVFIGKDGVLYAVDGISGWVLWKMNLQQQVSAPLYAEDVNNDGFKEILFVADSGILFCFSHMGTLLWQVALEDRCHPELLFVDVNNDRIRDIVVSLLNGKVTVFSGLSKMRMWEFQMDRLSIRHALASYDADRDGIMDLVLADATPSLYVVQGTTGKELARIQVDLPPQSALVCAERSCYYMDAAGNLRIVRFVVNR